MVVVKLLNLPGDRRALVDAETADLMVRLGHAKRLDRLPGERRQPVRDARPPRR
jgi:hypothetical protein